MSSIKKPTTIQITTPTTQIISSQLTPKHSTPSNLITTPTIKLTDTNDRTVFGYDSRKRSVSLADTHYQDSSSRITGCSLRKISSISTDSRKNEFKRKNSTTLSERDAKHFAKPKSMKHKIRWYIKDLFKRWHKFLVSRKYLKNWIFSAVLIHLL